MHAHRYFRRSETSANRKDPDLLIRFGTDVKMLVSTCRFAQDPDLSAVCMTRQQQISSQFVSFYRGNDVWRMREKQGEGLLFSLSVMFARIALISVLRVVKAVHLELPRMIGKAGTTVFKYDHALLPDLLHPVIRVFRVLSFSKASQLFPLVIAWHKKDPVFRPYPGYFFHDPLQLLWMLRQIPRHTYQIGLPIVDETVQGTVEKTGTAVKIRDMDDGQGRESGMVHVHNRRLHEQSVNEQPSNNADSCNDRCDETNLHALPPFPDPLPDESFEKSWLSSC